MDRAVKCKECDAEFVITEEEQESFKKNNIPERQSCVKCITASLFKGMPEETKKKLEEAQRKKEMYPKLTKKELAALPDNELYDACILRTEKYDPVIYGDKAYKNAPVPCQNIIAILMLDAQVLNGGFTQFYYNGYGGYAKEFDIDFAKAFENLGLKETAKIIKDADKFYQPFLHNLSANDNGSVEGYTKFLELCPENDFDDKYAELYNKNNLYVRRYIKKHIDVF